MSDLKYYLSIFIRRLPAFLSVSVLISAIAVIVAMTLPPAYVSRTQLFVEAPQIPDELAPTTVRTPGRERLQIVERRLLTRPNMLEIARKLTVLKDQGDMNPDEIVLAMLARTDVKISSGRNRASLMSISFEAREARLAAQVLNEYLNHILSDDADYRKSRAGQTLDFFELEVQRLNQILEERGAEILAFKNENSDALPDSLEFRLSQRANMQERLEQTEREVFNLRTQRQQLVTIFSQTGRVGGSDDKPKTAAEARLAEAEAELENALTLYSETNPRIKLLRTRVDKLTSALAAERAKASTENTEEETGNIALDLQLAQIDTRIETLSAQNAALEVSLAEKTDAIDRTPANAIKLEDLQRDYDNTQNQYNAAVERLSQASTGERIEVLSRGERISVIEQPAVPSQPTKPNRMLIAAGGSVVGVLLGLALVFLLEVMNTSARRPEDLINKLDVWPLATLPYVRSRRETFLQRGRKLLIILIILVGAPVAVWAVHTYYLPLDLLADRLMNKLGVRW